MKPVVTTWEVKFNRYTHFTVKANTFLDAVEEAKQIAKNENIPEDTLVYVKYLAY